MKYSVIIPCYKSSHTIREVVELTAAELDRLGRAPYEFILVDDFSPDDGDTVRVLHDLADEYTYVTVVELAQNAGQHNAVMCGLNAASGDAIISMDDDLQTHPSQLHLMFDEFDKGYDIVYGVYDDKHHSGFRNFGSWVNHTSARILIGKPRDMRTSSFWIARKFVRDYVIQYKGSYTHLQGLLLRTTRNVASVTVEHFDRAHGSSGYTFNKLVSLWSNIMGYSVVPLRIARNVGTFFALIGLIGALAIVIKKIVAPTSAIGWYSLIVAIFFFSGLIMLFLGLIGEYLGRLYLGFSQNPQYVIKRTYTGPKSGADGVTSGIYNDPAVREQEV